MVILDFLAGILFPSQNRCFSCEEEFFTQNPFCLCDSCLEKIKFINSTYCKICGTKISGAGELCLRCKDNSLKEITLARSLCEYDGIMKDVVHNFKYHNCQYLAKYLSKMLFDYYVHSNDFKDEDMILPVPISKEKLKKRGYNQSNLLARNFEITNKVNYDILTKIKETESQTTKNREERLKNLQGCFVVLDRSLIKGKKILLIDDVFTTGATCLTIAKLLKKCGAMQVKCLTLCSTTNYFLKDEAEKN